MNVCKYCKKYGVCSLMTKLGLIGKHIIFFIKALFCTLFRENFLLNITVVILYLVTQFYLAKYLDNIDLLYGAYLGILVTANLQLANDKYRKEILWDGDWRILNNEKFNFEHKRDVYICLCGELSDIISMIINYLGEPYRSGRVMSVSDFNKVTEIYRLNSFEQWSPDFNYIDEIDSYGRFYAYVNSFSQINEVISSLQNIQTHLNSYCPKFNVKSSIALLLNELFITSSKVKDLKIFINNSSVNDDALKWHFRLRELLEQKQINIDALKNNVRNLVIHLSLIYNDINNDYDFENKER